MDQSSSHGPLSLDKRERLSTWILGQLMSEPAAVVYCFLPNNKGLIIIAMIIIIAWRNTKSKKVQEERSCFFFPPLKSPRGSKLIAEDGFDPSPSGLWAQRASAAPLCLYWELSPQSKEASSSLDINWDSWGMNSALSGSRLSAWAASLTSTPALSPRRRH